MLGLQNVCFFYVFNIFNRYEMIFGSTINNHDSNLRAYILENVNRVKVKFCMASNVIISF